MEEQKTINLQEYALKSYNYYNRMVDKDGLPYFNIFWTEPAQAAHDWPDFGDVMSRQLQAAVMGRVMTGQKAEIEDTWYKKILSYMDSESGLLMNPVTPFTLNLDYMGVQALTLYSLVTAYLDNRDEGLKDIVIKLIDGMNTVFEKDMKFPDICNDAFGLKGLMIAARYLGYEPALKLAGKIVRNIFEIRPIFSPDNNFKHGGHMHGNLRALAGAADYALFANDPVIFSRVDAVYRYVRSLATSFGFLPEETGRKGDIVLCETCALMDYIGVATTLANHGHPEYWDDIEKTVRNQLTESQITDTTWLKSDGGREDTVQFTWNDVGERMKGGYSGWSSPSHILACREVLFWGGPEIKGKPRAFQNCCGGSGTHAFFIAWKNSSRFEDGCLLVNMHFDKLLPQAEIRCLQPYKGLTSIKLTESCKVKVRIPAFVEPGKLVVKVNGKNSDFRVWGNYMELGQRESGDSIDIHYPMNIYENKVTIGNEGFKQYSYKVTWKGDTVVRMEPIGTQYSCGYSEKEKRDIPVYYGTEGPGALYRRDHMLGDTEPSLSPLHMDDGRLDFWVVGKK